MAARLTRIAADFVSAAEAVEVRQDERPVERVRDGQRDPQRPLLLLDRRSLAPELQRVPVGQVLPVRIRVVAAAVHRPQQVLLQPETAPLVSRDVNGSV